jgi:CelD/BcsL family acetyltransferase involved in cellulose biosynthesis
MNVGLVRTRGEVAAIELALSCRDRVAVHLIAYNLKFEKTGAGALLMQESIRQACQSGNAVLDLLPPGSAYKFDWTDRAMAVNDHAVGLTAPGRLYASLYLKRIRPAAKSSIEQMPATVRRHVSTVLAALLVVGS